MAEVEVPQAMAFDGIDEEDEEEVAASSSTPPGRTPPPRGAPLRRRTPEELEATSPASAPASPVRRTPSGKAVAAKGSPDSTPSTRASAAPSPAGTPALAPKMALPVLERKLSDAAPGPRTPRLVGAAGVVRRTSSGLGSLTASLPPLNARVCFKVHGADHTGKVVFAGLTEFAEGNWVGVVMDTRDGKHDGVVKGKRYFTCADGHGLFIRPQMVTKTYGGLESLDRDLMPHDSVSCVSGMTDTTVSFCSTAQNELVDELRTEVSSLRQLHAEQARQAEEMTERAQALARTAEEQLAAAARASREAAEEARRLREEVEYERRCRRAEEAERRRAEQEPRPAGWWDVFMSAFIASTCCSRPSSRRPP